MRERSDNDTGEGLALPAECLSRGDEDVVAIDLETGGFFPAVNPILAIGAYFPGRSLGILVEREEGTVVDPEAGAKCGWVSDEQWRDLGAVPLRAALASLRAWLYDVAVDTASLRLEPLAHNHAGVDRPFLEYWTQRYGYDMREEVFGKEGLLSHAWHDSMLTMRAAQVAGLMPAEGGATLDALLEAMGWHRRVGAHSARFDARACYEGYRYLTGLMAAGRRAA